VLVTLPSSPVKEHVRVIGCRSVRWQNNLQLLPMTNVISKSSTPRMKNPDADVADDRQ